MSEILSNSTFEQHWTLEPGCDRRPDRGEGGGHQADPQRRQDLARSARRPAGRHSCWAGRRTSPVCCAFWRAERPPAPPSTPRRRRTAPPQRWATAQLGLQRFVAEGWGDQAILLGWTVEELYAVPALWSRIDLCGVALLIDDRRVAAITETSIAIATPRDHSPVSPGWAGARWLAPFHLVQRVQKRRQTKMNKISIAFQGHRPLSSSMCPRPPPPHL